MKRSTHAWVVAAGCAAAALAFSTSVEAQQSIGVNFSGGAGSEAPDPDIDTVDAGESTGVVAQTNWNNAQGGSGNIANLTGSNGAATGASLTYASNNTWGRDLPQSATNDLLSDYLDAGTGVPATVTVSNVPYALYDVYVYTRRNENPEMPGGVPDADDLSDYTVNGVTQTVLTGDVRDNFVLSTPTTIGNYVRFANVTGSTMTLGANQNAANFRSPVDGFQIVQVPEPTSMGVLGLGALAPLALRRWRRVAR